MFYHVPLTEAVIVALYGVSMAALSVYGLHRAVLLRLYWKHKNRQTLPVEMPNGFAPFVTVQLPVYNERFVVEGLIEAACGLDYPADRIEVQVLDDSTDETTAIAAAAVERLAAAGHAIALLHRSDREGFKAGALAAGLEQARGELIAVFDADFRPERDFLKRLAGHFADAKTGCVQARWTFRNREKSLLTRLQAMLLDGHFVLEQGARSRAGRMFNFNGTAGILRRETIEDAGGWQGDTLAEDTDLSYRAQMRGWRFVYRPDVEVSSELPEDMASFQTQQARWAKGLIQTAVKLLPAILRSRQTWKVKLEAWLHLTANVTYVCLAAVSALVVPTVLIRARYMGLEPLLLDIPVFGATCVSLAAFYMTAERELFGERWRRSLALIPAAMALGIALTISNLQAVLEALAGYRTPFQRTAKSGEAGAAARTYWRSGGWLAWANLAGAAYFAAAMGFTSWAGAWAGLPFLGLFAAGYFYAGGLALRQGSN